MSDHVPDDVERLEDLVRLKNYYFGKMLEAQQELEKESMDSLRIINEYRARGREDLCKIYNLEDELRKLKREIERLKGGKQ